jgi:signal transduction histidine kinase/HAMP domain-containing protein
VTYLASLARPISPKNFLVGLVARAPGRVQTKLLIAFLTIAGLLVAMGAVAVRALSLVNNETQQLIALQREIAAYRQVQQDTTAQLYGLSNALLFPDDQTLETALRQLNQFGYDLDRLTFISRRQESLVKEVQQEYGRLVASATKVAALVRAGQTAQAREAQTSASVPQADRLQRLTNQLVNIAEADMVAAIESAGNTYKISQVIVLAFALASILLALALGYVISWSLVTPVKAIEARLRGIAAGDFSHVVEVANRDELGTLAANINRTSKELGRLYSIAEMRAQHLAESLDQLRALGEVSQAVNSTLELRTVLSTIVTKAVQLSDTQSGAIFVYSARRRGFSLRASYGMSKELVGEVKKEVVHLGKTPLGRATHERTAVQITDLRDEPPYPLRDLLLGAGFRALLVIPLVGAHGIVGGLLVQRSEAGAFLDSTLDVLQTFAAQSVLAIQNARLFSEAEEKGRELEIASKHKSQFLANMSHELRTPLNSVLGFSEMLTDGIYGILPERAQAALEKIRTNGRHLLNLINDVLDLSKIEAGQLVLSLRDYSIRQVVQSALAAVEAQARAKGVTLTSSLPDELPTCFGDEQRVTQILLNLLSNAVKFTDHGSVDAAVRVIGEASAIQGRE